jgi:hypothetical protein
VKAIHKAKGYWIRILANRGKPVINRKGYITLVGKSRYRSFDTISAELFDEKFEVVV